VKAVIYRPEAAADVEEACAWYERQRVGLAAEFLASLQAGEDAVRATLLAYQLHRRDTRRYRLRRFPYQLFYRILGTHESHPLERSGYRNPAARSVQKPRLAADGISFRNARRG
jgi:hypothetical protein